MSQDDILSASEDLYNQAKMPAEAEALRRSQAEESEDSSFLGQLWNDVLTRPIADLTKSASVGKQIQYLAGKRGEPVQEDDYPTWRAVRLAQLDRMAFPGGLTPKSFTQHETFTDPMNPAYAEVDRKLKTYFDSRVKGRVLSSYGMPDEDLNAILAKGELPELPTQTPQSGASVGQAIGGAVTGIENFVLGTIGFLTSPLGIVAPAAASVGTKAKAAVSLGFAGMMASHLPALYNQFREAIKSGNTGEASRLGTEGVLTLLGAGVAGTHGLIQGIKAFRGEPAPITKPAEVVAPKTAEADRSSAEALPARPSDPISKPAEVVAAKTTEPAKASETPLTEAKIEVKVADIATEAVPMEPRFPLRTGKTTPWEDQLGRPVELKDDPSTGRKKWTVIQPKEGDQGAISQQTTTQLLRDVQQPKVPPEGAGQVPAAVSGEGVPARGQVQETPGGVPEVKPKGGEIIERQEAQRVLTPEPAVATAAAGPSFTESLNAHKAMTNEQLANSGRTFGGSGGPTAMAWELGSKARTPEDVAALRSMAEESNARVRSLMQEGKLEEAMSEAGRQPAEAYEYATGVKLDGTPKWQAFESRDPNYKPPVPDAKYLEAHPETRAAAGSGPPLTPTASATAQPQPPIGKTPKSQRQIIEDLARGLNLPIRFGRLVREPFKKGPAGYFKSVANIIGSKKANDIPVVSHEAGHKLDAEFNLSQDPALASELMALGDPASPGSRSSWTPKKSQQYRLEEGVAEFTRHWLNDGPAAQAMAPNTFARFEAALNANKDFGDTMRTAQSDIKTWREAPSQARLRSHISVGENPNKTPYTLSQLTRDLVDDLHFLRLAVDDAKKFSAAGIDPSQNPYLLARNLRGSFGMAASFIRNGVADFKTKSVQLGTSLEDALKPVAGRIADFRDWIVAKRAQELHAQGRDTGLVDADIQNTAARFNNDAAFQEAFTKVKAWNDALLKYAEDSGLVTPDAAAKMREMNRDYVPMHRVFEVGAGESPSVESGGAGRGLNVGKPGSLNRLSGSQRTIVDPLETMVKNAYTIITAAEKNAINLGVANLADRAGMGKWVEKIETPQDKINVGLSKIREQLLDAGANLDGVPNDLLITFFQNSKQAPFGENVIKVVRNGKPEFYRLKRELFDTFHSLDLDDAGTLLRMLSQPAHILRAGVTLAPDFALANAIRDTFGAAVISKHGLLPFESTARGIFALLKNPKLVAEWEAAGGKSAIEATYFDRSKVQKFLNEKITKDLTPAERATIVAKSPLTALRWLTGLSEEATRIGEYQKAFNDLTRRGVPEGEARRMAAFEARDRQDFSKGGSKTKILRHATAFWNAALQANVRLAQAFKERPASTTLKGLAYVTLPKLLEQYVNWDDEDYWDRPQWERDLFFLIPYGKDESGHTKFIRIPTPFEIGLIFGTFPGRILQSIREKDPEALKEFPLEFIKQTVPNPIPQTLQVVFSAFLSGRKGWDIWRGRTVVPESIADLPPEMQWTEQTSLTARRAGELLGFAPVKIDHIIAGTTGGMGRQVSHQILDRVIALATGEERPGTAVVPGGRFVTAPAPMASESINQFYETLDRLRASKAGGKKLREPSGVEGMVDLFEGHAREMSDLRRQMRESNDPEVKQMFADAILTRTRQLMEVYRASRP